LPQGLDWFQSNNRLLKDFATYGVVWLGLDGKPLVEHVVTTTVKALNACSAPTPAGSCSAADGRLVWGSRVLLWPYYSCKAKEGYVQTNV